MEFYALRLRSHTNALLSYDAVNGNSFQKSVIAKTRINYIQFTYTINSAANVNDFCLIKKDVVGLYYKVLSVMLFELQIAHNSIDSFGTLTNYASLLGQCYKVLSLLQIIL